MARFTEKWLCNQALAMNAHAYSQKWALQLMGSSIWETSKLAFDLKTPTIDSAAPLAWWSPVGAGSACTTMLRPMHALLTASIRTSAGLSITTQTNVSVTAMHNESAHFSHKVAEHYHCQLFRFMSFESKRRNQMRSRCGLQLHAFGVSGHPALLDSDTHNEHQVSWGSKVKLWASRTAAEGSTGLRCGMA